MGDVVQIGSHPNFVRKPDNPKQLANALLETEPAEQGKIGGIKDWWQLARTIFNSRGPLAGFGVVVVGFALTGFAGNKLARFLKPAESIEKKTENEEGQVTRMPRGCDGIGRRGARRIQP